ncbi:ATP-binding protein [Actinoallomurus iriomotensis]|uniref:ATP-binding protein n=1 Tax=Actinoallomurus iriomotensis TaxID=478107 RepID=UPI0025564C5E|nr:ATP-binding protein [Actinoallomurus iriomotensis]
MSSRDAAAGSAGAAERLRYRFPLPPHPIAAEQARIVARLALADFGMDAVIDDALLIAVELVANAVKVGEVFHLTLTRQSGAVLIEVSDSSEAAPERQRHSFDRVDGRGLLLVEACSKDWGWRLETTGGKTVWALLGDVESSASPMNPLPPANVPAADPS